jgi:hypothetical protein
MTESIWVCPKSGHEPRHWECQWARGTEPDAREGSDAVCQDVECGGTIRVEPGDVTLTEESEDA